MSDSDTKGTQEAATSEGSDNGSNQTGSSKQTYVTVEQLNALLAQQTESLRRTLQSEKDKAVKQTNQRLDAVEGDVRSVLQKAKSEGRSIDDVMTELDQQEELEFRNNLREMTKAFREGLTPGKQSVGSESEQGVNVVEVLSDLELDPNSDDMRIKEFQSRKFGSKDEAFREGAKLVRSLTKAPADAAEDPGRRQRPADDQTQLLQEYEQGSKGLYGMPLLKFKQKMRAKGLNIH